MYNYLHTTHTQPGVDALLPEDVAVLEHDAQLIGGAVVSAIDGQWRGLGIPKLYQLTPGEHSVAAAYNGFGQTSASMTRWFYAKSGETYKVHVRIDQLRSKWEFGILEASSGYRVEYTSAVGTEPSPFALPLDSGITTDSNVRLNVLNKSDGVGRLIAFADSAQCQGGGVINRLEDKTVIMIPVKEEIAFASEVAEPDGESELLTTCVSCMSFIPAEGEEYFLELQSRPGSCRVELYTEKLGVKFAVPLVRREPLGGFGSNCESIEAR